MLFKLEMNANLDSINFSREKDSGREKDSVIFSLDNQTSVIIRRPTLEEQKIGHQANQIFCTATLERKPNPEILEMFECLRNNRMPKGFKKPKSLDKDFPDFDIYDYIDDEGNIKDRYIVGLDLMPPDFQEFYFDINKTLLDFLRRTIKILRWRHNLEGKHNPIQSWRGFYWSFDGKDWKSMPHSSVVKISQGSFSPITTDVRDEVQNLVRKGFDEPIGHIIFREAWKQKEQNPRSSLILSIVSIEVGFKQCLGILLPQAQWLVENLPSPPITKMLSNFLPQLSTKLDIKGNVLPPPKFVMKLLQNGIEKRNKIVHIGSLVPEHDELEKLLLAVRDTLYLLDYYCGNSWSLNNIGLSQIS